jgi:hypothetical protein
MFHRVSRSEIMDTVSHLRGLHRQIKPANEQESRTAERREILIRHLISNLNRISEHPTLTLVLQISELLSLTIEGAHRMFGYNLGSMREYDMRLNGGRTHIVESYIFERDRIVDVPSEFAAAEAFRSDATLGDLIRRWQDDVPVRSLRGRGWSRPGAFYIHVGTKDSAGTHRARGGEQTESACDLSPSVRGRVSMQPLRCDARQASVDQPFENAPKPGIPVRPYGTDRRTDSHVRFSSPSARV